MYNIHIIIVKKWLVHKYLFTLYKMEIMIHKSIIYFKIKLIKSNQIYNKHPFFLRIISISKGNFKPCKQCNQIGEMVVYKKYIVQAQTFYFLKVFSYST